MERNWNLEERTDGKRYNRNDMVRVGCNDCKGCSACCYDMGTSIVLDPWDIFWLTAVSGQTMEGLLRQAVELNVVDGIVLPNLKMQESTGGCFYLNPEGRCQIHENRPGICRLFPLGRIYAEDGAFQYFLQTKECKAEQKTKVKLKQWLGIADICQYEEFVCDWHAVLKEYQNQAKCGALQGEALRQISMKILQLFYMQPYQQEVDFYMQYKQRRKMLLT